MSADKCTAEIRTDEDYNGVTFGIADKSIDDQIESDRKIAEWYGNHKRLVKKRLREKILLNQTSKDKRGEIHKELKNEYAQQFENVTL